MFKLWLKQGKFAAGQCYYTQLCNRSRDCSSCERKPCALSQREAALPCSRPPTCGRLEPGSGERPAAPAAPAGTRVPPFPSAAGGGGGEGRAKRHRLSRRPGGCCRSLPAFQSRLGSLHVARWRPEPVFVPGGPGAGAFRSAISLTSPRTLSQVAVSRGPLCR